MGKYIAAVDLGTTKVATIVGEKTNTGLKIIGYSEAPSSGGITRGEVVNIQKVLEALKTAVDSVNEQINTSPDVLNLKIDNVYVGIGGQEIIAVSDLIQKSRKYPLASIDEKEMAEIMNEIYASPIEDNMQIIHVEPQSYNVDERMGIKDIIGVIGSELEIQYKMFLIKKNVITHTESVIAKAKLNIKKLITKHIATADAILTDDEKELGCALLDIGGGTTNLIIYHDNIVRHIAVIPFGGNIITDDIKQTCGISYKNSELLKKKHGYCISEYAPLNKHVAIKDKKGNLINDVPFSILAETIEARMCEIIATAMHEIEISGNKNRIRSGIVLTGGSTGLIHIQNLVHHLTKYHVRVASPNSDNLNKMSIQDIFTPSASTAVGLLLTGMKMEEKEEAEESVEQTVSISEENKNKNPRKREKGKKTKKDNKKFFENFMGDLFKPNDDEA